jgi:hypothetical protein
MFSEVTRVIVRALPKYPNRRQRPQRHGNVATRPRQTRDETEPDRVLTDGKDDWNRRGRRLGRQCRRVSGRGDHRNPFTPLTQSMGGNRLIVSFGEVHAYAPGSVAASEPAGLSG